MKKFFAFPLILGLILSLSACVQISGLIRAADSGAAADGNSGDGRIVADANGYAEGFVGDVMRTAFFDFTVNSAYTCPQFEGYAPSAGNTLLVTDVTFYNYTISSQPMYDTDLQAQWSGSENNEDFALPITYARTDLYPNTGVEPVGDMFPTEFSLGIQETRRGLLVYEVPAGKKDYNLSFLEYFEDESYGDLFFVYFTPEVRESVEF